MKKKIIIVTGDPNSINSEIIFKTWKKLSKSIRAKIYLISNFKLMETQFKKLNYSFKIEKVKDINTNNKSNNIKIIDIDIKFKDPFNVPFKNPQKFVINSLNLAHNLGLKQNVSGIINCAINKNLLGKKNQVLQSI